MLTQVLIRPQSRLMCRSRIISALYTARRSNIFSKLFPKASATARDIKRSNPITREPLRVSEIIKEINDIPRLFMGGYESFKQERHIIIYICWATSIAFTVKILAFNFSNPLLPGWPPVLKEDLKAGGNALLADDYKRAIVHLGNAWLKMQRLTQEELSPDPNFKILKVAYMLGVSLLGDRQYTETFNFIIDMLSQRGNRLYEERVKLSEKVDVGKGSALVSMEERLYTIALCLYFHRMAQKLGTKFEYEGMYLLAYAYAECARLTRVRDAKTGEPKFNSSFDPLSFRPLFELNESLKLANDPAFYYLDHSDVARESSWWQDFWIPSPIPESASTAENLIALTTESMGDLMEIKMDQPVLAYEMFLRAASLIRKPGHHEERQYRNFRVINKFFRLILDLHESRLIPESEKAKLSTVSHVSENLKKLESTILELRFQISRNNPLAPELCLFQIIQGRALLMMGRREEAVNKFRQGLDFAKALECGKEATLAEEWLRKAQFNWSETESGDKEAGAGDDNASLVLILEER